MNQEILTLAEIFFRTHFEGNPMETTHDFVTAVLPVDHQIVNMDAAGIQLPTKKSVRCNGEDIEVGDVVLVRDAKNTLWISEKKVFDINKKAEGVKLGDVNSSSSYWWSLSDHQLFLQRKAA